MISQDTVNKILDSAQIVDVIKDFVSLKRRGANYIACCPFHNEKTPSFYVSPSKGIYKCFGCGKSGSAVGFVMEHEGMTYVEALKYLARKYGIEVKEKEETPEEIAQRQRSESLYLVMDFAQQFFKDSLKTPEGRSIGYEYFRSRGLEDATIDKFGLGWSPKDGSALSRTALAKGYKPEFLTAVGVSIRRNDGSLIDKFYDRVMFPVHSVSGRVIAFGGRTLISDYKKANIGKYINSPETEIYDKSSSLYGIYFAKSEISRQDKCYLVEGYLDVLSMHQLGISNVVASSGTSLTVNQIRLIKKFTDNITIMYDGDAAGIHAALRGIGLILKEGLNVKVVLIPDGDDPDSYARKHTLDEVKDFIDKNEQDFIAYKTALLKSQAGNDPLKIAELINDIADTIALIPDKIKQAVYVQNSAQEFNIDEQMIFSRISETTRRIIEEERKEAERERRRAEAAAGSQSGSDGQSGAVPQGDAGVSGGDNAGEAGGDSGSDAADVRGSAGSSGAAGGSGRRTGLEAPMMEPSEKDLLCLILKYGQNYLEFESDSEYYDSEEKCTVADFIRDAIEDNPFQNTIYKRVYDMYFDMYDSELPQDTIVKRLLDGPDRVSSGIVADLIEYKYQLSVKNFVNSLTAVPSFLVLNVPNAIMVYNSSLVKTQEEEIASKLRELSRVEQTEEVMKEQDALLVKMQKVAELRKKIAERLGRVL